MVMEWNRLLNPGCLRRPDYKHQPGRPYFQQDYDRILFSEPFRRLAQKTQVHPLYDHDHVHHRMIHSMETSSVGRSLGMGVGQKLVERGSLEPGQQHELAGVVQAACLVHDIGNPPFGHSGEESIGDWFAKQFQAGAGLAAEVAEPLRAEFEAFEGNAQGLRIVSQLEMGRQDGGMRLSYATLGAFSKYPCTAAARAASGEDYVGLKKFGVFNGEQALFAEVAQALGLPEETAGANRWWRRHPLAFLVEAADDICYRILDIEDAATVGDLDRATVTDVLEQITGRPNNSRASEMSVKDRVGLLRAQSIGSAIEAAIAAFIENYDSIMLGEFNEGLMEVSSKAQAFAHLKDLSNRRIFVARRKTELEVLGRQVLHNVLDHFHELYADLATCGWDQDRFLQKHGYWAKLVRAVELDLREVHDGYSAMHNLADFVSGMTDRYAVRVQDMITGRVTG